MTRKTPIKSLDSNDMMHRHNHDDCMEHALQAAESICAGQNIRLTPIRKRILELICASHQAIGAYQLLDQLKLEDSKAKPATIYRALDFLMDAGLVHKVESLNAYIGCLTADKDHHSAILICNRCNNAFEIDAEVCYSDLFEKSRSFGFNPHELTLELRGVCVDCQAKA